MKYLIILFASLMISTFSSCSTTVTNDQTAPVLDIAITDLSIRRDSTLKLTLEYVEAYDTNGDNLTLIVHEAENYTVEGTSITPTLGFIGDLFVPVQVSDGDLLSDTKIIIISVVSVVELFPFLDGAWWKYRDSVYNSDTVAYSEMSLGNSEDKVVDGEYLTIYNVTWSHLAEYNIVYHMSSNNEGTILHGAISPWSEINDPQQLYHYPLTQNESWEYRTLQYNISTGEFIQGEANDIVCTDTSIYVTVPAGTFKAFELTLKYTLDNSESITSTGIVSSGADNVNVTEKLYYSVGVGYIKNITMFEDEVVWVKELMDYNVIETIEEGEN